MASGRALHPCAVAMDHLVIMPVNRRAEGDAGDAVQSVDPASVGHWGRLHGVRSAFGIAATLVYLWAAA